MPTTLTLTAPGQPDQVLAVPTSWADVSLAAFVALHAPAPAEPRTAAELLLGLPAGALDQLAADDVAYISNLLAFASDPSPVLELLPTPGLPDIGTLPYGLVRAAQLELEANEGRGWLASGPHLLALCRCCLTWGGAAYEARVPACQAALLAAPVTEVYGDLAFFLSSYKRYSSGTPPTPKTPSSRRAKNWMRATSIWKSALGRCLASMRWRRATP